MEKIKEIGNKKSKSIEFSTIYGKIRQKCRERSKLVSEIFKEYRLKPKTIQVAIGHSVLFNFSYILEVKITSHACKRANCKLVCGSVCVRLPPFVSLTTKFKSDAVH